MEGERKKKFHFFFLSPSILSSYQKQSMAFYQKLFIGFYCLTKKYIAEKNYPEHYAVACMAGSASFLYFAMSYYLLKRGATTLETVGIFLVLYAAHHFLFLKDDKHKELEKAIACTDQLIYRSVLYFVMALSLLMFITNKVS